MLLAAIAGLQMAVPLVPSESVAQGTGAIFALAWLLVALFALALLPSMRVPLRWGAPEILTGLLGVWILGSAIARAWSGNPRATWNVTWQWLALLAGFWTVRHVFRGGAERRAMAAVMIALATLLASHGMYQFFYGIPLQRARYHEATERQKQEILRANGVDPNPTSPQRRHFEDRLRSTEPFATFALTNSLAGLLAPWLVVAGGLLLASARRTNMPLSARVLLAAVSAAMLLCLVLTKSRAAWLATTAGALVLFVPGLRAGQHPTVPRALVALLAIAAAVLVGVLSGALDRQVVTEIGLSAAYRFQYWQAALQMVLEWPLFGTGPGNFQDYYTQFKLPIASETVADPHNLVLEVAAIAGIVAGLAFIGLLAVVTWRLLPRHSYDEPPSEPGQGGHYASVLGIYIGGCVASVLGVVIGWNAGFAPDIIPAIDLPVIWVLGPPLLAAVLFLLDPWVRRGTLPRSLIFAAWITALLNLLAAGGISYPGVAQTFWLLAALGLAIADPPASPATAAMTFWNWRTMAMMLCGVGLAFGCWLNGVRPVREASRLLNLAARSQTFERATSLYAAAAQADPWDPRPWQWLAEVHQLHWLEDRAPDRQRDVLSSLEQARRRDSRSFSFAMREGWLHLQTYRAAGTTEALERSLEAYRRATKLYPNSNYAHAQLAWVLHVAGQGRAAAEEAELALKLDALNPHIEQKLSQRTLADPAESMDGEPHGPPAPTERAEQVMQKLRTAKDQRP